MVIVWRGMSALWQCLSFVEKATSRDANPRELHQPLAFRQDLRGVSCSETITYGTDSVIGIGSTASRCSETSLSIVYAWCGFQS